MAPGFTKIHTEMDSVDRSEDDEMEMPDESQSVDESDDDIRMNTEVSYTILLQSFIFVMSFCYTDICFSFVAVYNFACKVYSNILLQS